MRHAGSGTTEHSFTRGASAGHRHDNDRSVRNGRSSQQDSSKDGGNHYSAGSKAGNVTKKAPSLDPATMRLKSVALQRKLSAFQSPSALTAGPSLAVRHGSLCSYFYAPHPTPSKGVSFSPKGDLFIRFGFSAEIKLLRTYDASVVTSLKGSPGHVRFAAFSADGKYIMAASDGGECHRRMGAWAHGAWQGSLKSPPHASMLTVACSFLQTAICLCTAWRTRSPA